jgi:hypothetical protein
MSHSSPHDSVISHKSIQTHLQAHVISRVCSHVLLLLLFLHHEHTAPTAAQLTE